MVIRPAPMANTSAALAAACGPGEDDSSKTHRMQEQADGQKSPGGPCQPIAHEKHAEMLLVALRVLAAAAVQELDA